MNRYILEELTPYALLVVLLFAIGMALFTPSDIAIDAAPAPTATPAPLVTPTSNTQHWLLENDGDVAYLLTQPGCYLTEQELGEDSRVFTLECDPVRGGGVDVRLKDGE